jgi:hypothetical protein
MTRGGMRRKAEEVQSGQKLGKTALMMCESFDESAHLNLHLIDKGDGERKRGGEEARGETGRRKRGGEEERGEEKLDDYHLASGYRV